MTGSDVSTLLERAADRVQPGPLPLGEVMRTARRMRRRRTLAVTAASVIAVLAVVGSTALLPTSGDRPSGPSAASPGPAEAPLEVPTGTRLVGLGPVAVAVPAEWRANRTRCGTPTEDTVTVDMTVVRACLSPRDAGIESVELISGDPRSDFHADEIITVDGVRAQRQRTACAEQTGQDQGGTLCTGTIHFPSELVSVRVESSTGSTEVDDLLARVRVLDDHVGVPGFHTIWNSSADRPLARYRDRLISLGLKAEVQAAIVPRGIPAEQVEAVSPAPGTVLPSGATVTVTVTAHAGATEPTKPTEPTEPTEPVDRGCDLDVSALRAGSIADYQPVLSPQEYAEGAGVVARARVARVLEGFTVGDGSATMPYLILEFAVTEQIRANEPDLVHNGFLYVLIEQGPTVAGTGRPATGIDTFRRALPAGTDAILFVSRFQPEYFNNSAITETPEAPALPPGAPLVGAGIQGMVLDDCGTLVGGHEDLAGPGWTRYTTLDQLQAAIEQRG